MRGNTTNKRKRWQKGPLIAKALVVYAWCACYKILLQKCVCNSVYVCDGGNEKVRQTNCCVIGWPQGSTRLWHSDWLPECD